SDIEMNSLNRFKEVALYSVTVFAVSSLRYISEVYIYINDDYSGYLVGSILVEIFSVIMVYFIVKYFNFYLLPMYIGMIVFRSLYVLIRSGFFRYVNEV